ncbi:hypothetical protein ACE5JW_08525 [Acinetobacter radioresistens]|jgi:hypothetical protein|uniref:Uncharacterized protein n=1 Tax=Acinetobacter radioresistens SK82 TaxID=596318 RepID=A0ABM9YNF5_ACIRA|nr:MULTISPECIES: hypothetical protein [Acinetobacter]EET82539.1 hypothetical protein ACIRA0001_2257 [Acinetobacter radioresistens SK82]EEY86896.1 hypothetical protein HMPREF0018_01469 [Acinetobacter radioresistens SH164]ENV84614.1 hypothetical protein F940_02634 [Acinetobacter radioresistens NIPH 2130]EXB80660.1 hypothetical protein J538_2896 [Acinetobacter sp. 272263]EXE54840.1 hypothetical protein J579_3136 [Acinetobacter sp. 1239920]
MNDFFLAANRSITVNDVEVHQIQMKDFDQWAVHAEKIKGFLKEKDYSDEVLTQLFKAHSIEVLSICSLATRLPVASLIDLATTSEQQFKEVLSAVLQVNGAYFKEDQPKRRNKKQAAKDNDSTWFDSFQLLISAGHTHTEIMNMTYGAYSEYLKSAQKDYRNKLAALTSVVRSAQHASAKELKKFLDELK